MGGGRDVLLSLTADINSSHAQESLSIVSRIHICVTRKTIGVANHNSLKHSQLVSCKRELQTHTVRTQASKSTESVFLHFKVKSLKPSHLLP